MLRYITILFSPLILFLGFWTFFNDQNDWQYYMTALAIFVILLSGRILARKKFWKFKAMWVNLVFVYIAQLLFLLLLISEEVRYLLAILLTIFWLLIWWMMYKYFEDIDNVESSNYLVVNKFFYYLGFWFLSTSLYSLAIFIHFPLWESLLILLIATFFWSFDIIRTRDDLDWLYLIFTIFLMAQVLIVVYLLPINFYVAGTIATLWFFFIIDNTANTLRSFRLYLGLFLLAIVLLLSTSII